MMMKSLNRSSLVLRPREPYRRFCGTASSVEDQYVVLVPNLQNRDECLAYIRENGRFARVFEFLLQDCFRSLAERPNHASFEVFLEWFDVEYHGVVIDLADDFLPVGPAKHDVYFRVGSPSWWIGSSGLLSDAEWSELRALEKFSGFQPGYSNQPEKE